MGTAVLSLQEVVRILPPPYVGVHADATPVGPLPVYVAPAVDIRPVFAPSVEAVLRNDVISRMRASAIDKRLAPLLIRRPPCWTLYWGA